MAVLAPWIATRRHAVLLLTDETGSNVANNVQASFVWDTTNTLINNRPGTLTTVSFPTMGVGACTDAGVTCRFVRRDTDLEPSVVLGAVAE